MKNFTDLTMNEMMAVDGGYSEMDYRRAAAKSMKPTSAADRKAAVDYTHGYVTTVIGLVNGPLGGALGAYFVLNACK